MTSQQLPERRPKKIDLNLLPPEYLPRKVSRLNIALVILIVLTLCLSVLFVFLKADVDAESTALQRELNGLNAQLNDLYALKRDTDALQAQIDAAKSALEAIEQDYQTIIQNRVLWSEIVEEIDDAIPGKRVTLKSIVQSGSGVTLQGTATRDDYVWAYATALEESEYFSGVTPQSIVDTGEEVSFTITLRLSGGGGQ
jgi:Tfp pilus assembly protein PilN